MTEQKGSSQRRHSPLQVDVSHGATRCVSGRCCGAAGGSRQSPSNQPEKSCTDGDGMSSVIVYLCAHFYLAALKTPPGLGGRETGTKYSAYFIWSVRMLCANECRAAANRPLGIWLLNLTSVFFFCFVFPERSLPRRGKHIREPELGDGIVP